MAQRPVRRAGRRGSVIRARPGADFIDYLIADDVRDSARRGERLFRARPAPAALLSAERPQARRGRSRAARANTGLPDDAFVFCCFNQTVKITPEVFARWMSLLRAVPGSVLWLLEDNRWASANLRAAPRRRRHRARAHRHRAAAAARRASRALRRRRPRARYFSVHLAHDRERRAVDGLSAASRCAARLSPRACRRACSRAAASPISSRDTLDEYEALALRLATDARFMQDVRARLAAARDSAPLFDSPQFTRDLEALYLQITQ